MKPRTTSRWAISQSWSRICRVSGVGLYGSCMASPRCMTLSLTRASVAILISRCPEGWRIATPAASHGRENEVDYRWQGLAMGKTILVAEDEQVLRESLAELLTDEGYEVLQASNGK